MTTNATHTLILAGCYLALFAVGEGLYHLFKVKAEVTRKLVHTGTGLLALLFPLLLGSHWWVLLLCTAFALILLCSVRFNRLQSINAIDRRSAGSLAYPAAVYICYLSYQYHGHQLIHYYLPILVLAISDPLAALCGRKWPWAPYRIGRSPKTVLGSLVFFGSALLVAILSWQYLYGTGLLAGNLPAFAAIALLATVAEAVSPNGYDNLSVPFAVILGLLFTSSWITV